jgi:hypothetical protein
MYQDFAAWTKTLVILIACIHPQLSTLVPKQRKDQRSHHPHLASMQATKFLANTRTPGHPSYEVTGRPPGARPLRKPTLQRAFCRDIRKFFRDDLISESNYKKAHTTIHTAAVKSVRDKRGPNHVMSYPPPEVDCPEDSLPRAVQTTLNQLRSDWCKDLKTHQFLVRKAQDDICPGCLAAPQNTSHLVSCPVHPTDLKPIDLWRRHRKAASFLSSLPYFLHLFLLGPFPPPPLLEPPPMGGEAL